MDEDLETATARGSMDRFGREAKESEKLYLQAVVDRLYETPHRDRPNTYIVFALQAPITLLAASVTAFLAGMGSVVYAPLADKPLWGDNAKVYVDIPFFSIDPLTHGRRSQLSTAWQVFCAPLFSSSPRTWYTDC